MVAVHSIENVRGISIPSEGYQFTGFASELPANAGGGTREDHVLVSIISPFSAARVMAKRSVLHYEYVMEKFAIRSIDDAYLVGLLRLLAHLLPEREVVFPELA